jgi:flagellar biosynthesis protein FlhB
MSGDVDPEDKTEAPTEKRLHDAVERGEVAFSREAPLFASLSAALLVLIFVIPTHAEALLTALVGLIDDPAGWRIERGEDVLALAGPLVAAGMHFLLPTVILLTVAGLIASVAQSPPRIVPDRILPDASRISLRKGLSRVFGARGWTEFLKSLIKLAAVMRSR